MNKTHLAEAIAIALAEGLRHVQQQSGNITRGSAT